MNSPPNHKWEEDLDIDDSDILLTPIVRPTNNPHIVPEITTTTQTLISTQNHQVDTYGEFIEDVGEDCDFTCATWLSAIDYVNVDGGIITGCFGDFKKCLKNGKLKKVVTVIKSCTPNALGDLTVTLKDLSGTISGTIHYKVLTEERFTKAITVGAALILHNASVFSAKQSTHQYLNITKKNMVKVFHKDGGSA
ncbi:hypothetical protein Tco_1554340 [Tanacetum coccineum]